MKKYKINDQTDYSKKNKKMIKPKRLNAFDEDDEYIPRKRKYSGKRSHHKKTLKEKFWEDLTSKGEI